MSELLHERAALYAAGCLSALDREQFELLLDCHCELRAHVAGLSEVGAAVTVADLPARVALPASGLKARIMGLTAARPQASSAMGLVRSGPDGLVRWVNPAFTNMCGYALEELQGKKLGPILQGAKTDAQRAERLRRAVRACRPCRETLVNYHKSGSPYWVDIEITPVFDDAGQPLYLLAREHEIFEPV